MFSELDTDAFFAYAKAHHRDLVQQAERDALRRCAVLQKQGKASRSRRRPALRRSLKHGQRAVRLRGQTLWQRWVGVARTWASGHPSHTPSTSRG
jgi:hypothetical protein